MVKEEQQWQKATCYDIKFLQEFLRGEKREPVKIIDSFKLQEQIK